MENVKSIEWYEHMRIRPDWYLGKIGNGTSPDDGIYTIVKDIIGISVDEYLFGFTKEVSVYVEESSVSIRDFGRGFPLDSIINQTCRAYRGMGSTTPEEVDKHNPFKVANALSSEFLFSSFRDGLSSWVKTSKGIQLDYGAEKTLERSGFYVKFTPDRAIFPGYAFSEKIVEAIINDVVHKNAGLTITMNGVTFR